MKQFALDIGVNPQTLQKWSEEYRNIVKPLEEEGLIDSTNITKETALIIRNMAKWKNTVTPEWFKPEVAQ